MHTDVGYPCCSEKYVCLFGLGFHLFCCVTFLGGEIFWKQHDTSVKSFKNFWRCVLAIFRVAGRFQGREWGRTVDFHFPGCFSLLDAGIVGRCPGSLHSDLHLPLPTWSPLHREQFDSLTGSCRTLPCYHAWAERQLVQTTTFLILRPEAGSLGLNKHALMRLYDSTFPLWLLRHSPSQNTSG